MSLHISDPLEPERAKYRAIWQHEEYHKVSPGLEMVDAFMRILSPMPGETLIDLGCGDGRAGLEFERKGLLVTWQDLVDVLDPAVDRTRFIESSLWDYRWTLNNRRSWDYGYCVDVLEHLPQEYTMLAIERIALACRTAFIAIALVPDAFGQTIGQPLHLTVQPFTWWRDRIASICNLSEARDLCGRGLYLVKK
jgi:hypothetical protein